MTQSKTGVLVFLLAIPVSFLSFSTHLSPQPAYAEEVIFVVPGSSQPASVIDFDPTLQIISKGQSIVFVNPDEADHHLVVKSSDNQEVFDTGVLKKDQFVSHTFPENGEYSIQCELYPHMKGQITVTDDIASFTKTIPEHSLDVQLSWSPANPGVNEDTFFKVVFVDKETGKNHQHIDYQIVLEDSAGELIGGTGEHSVDGAGFATFSFDREDTFTPKVKILAIDWLPAGDITIEYNQIVTPEFPPAIIGIIVAAAVGSMALYGRKSGSIAMK